MKFNFRKISAVMASGLMALSGVGFAAAASFPAPFVVSGSADAAVVYGTGAGALDQTPANSIGNYLATKVTVGTGAPSGESLLFGSSSNNLNIGNTWTDAETGTIDESDLPTLLAKGTYIAGDNDQFKYEQSVKIGNPTLQHFRNDDYEELAGLPTKTPIIGFQIDATNPILNYTLDFTTDVVSDITGTSLDMDDIEGSDLMLFGKKYYVSDLKNGTKTDTTSYAGKLTLLDSASVATVNEGETVTVTSGGNTYEVSISFIDADEVRFMVNGVQASTNKLVKGDSAKLSDGAYIGVRDISKLVVAGEIGSATFSIGTGKLEITSNAEIKLNDVSVSGVKGYVFQTSGISSTEKIDKIVIEWIADDRLFLTADSELEMPGFGGLKFTMADLVRPTEEKILVEKDGDTSMKLALPIDDGDVSFNFLYANASGDFIGIGQDNTSRLATANANVLTFYQRRYSTTWDDWFVATYNVSSEAESYVLRAKISQTDGVNYTKIERMEDGVWNSAGICEEVKNTGDCSVGNIVLTTSSTTYSSNTKSVILTGNAGVNFNTIYTKGGLRIYLPYEAANTSLAMGAINFSTLDSNGGLAGHNYDTFLLFMDGENKDDTIAAGTEFNLTIDDSSDKLQVSLVNGLASVSSNELGQSTGTYETYMVDDVAPRIVHYTKSDNDDYAEVYYPSEDSETYAKVFLTDMSSTLSAAGQMVFKDSEKSSWSNKNVVIVGGSCINSAAAEALGLAEGTCGDAFEAATNIGAGKYLIRSVGDAFTTGKIALVVAGYHAADTAAAASRLIEPGVSVETIAGTNYIGTVGVSGSSTMSKVE